MDYRSTISEIFSLSKNYNFAVPNYQRAYTWEVGSEEDKQVVQFLQDLKDHPASVTQYHLGHFLFEQDQVDKNRFWLVDGQQRMTTIVIFMSCIYDRLANIDKADNEVVNLYNKYLVNTDGKHKFHTVDYDNNYFQNIVIEKRADQTKTKSQQRILECKNYFRKEIDKADLSDVLKWKQLVENAKITTDTIEDKAEATQIFTFQNDRGKDLTNLEKLKAYLMLQVYLFGKNGDNNPNDSIRYIEREFESIYECLEKLNIADEDQVLNYHTTAFITLTGPVLDRIKNAYKQLEIDHRIKWIKDFSVNLKRSFELIVSIQEYMNHDSYIPDVIYLDQANSLPLLLKLFHYHSIDKKFEKTFRLMEIILFRCDYTIGNYYSNYFSNHALEYAGDLQELNDILLNYAKNGFKNYWSFESNFRQYLEGDNHYDSSTRYLLWKFENELRKDVKESPMLYPEFANLYGTNKLENTLDHWTPQNPYDVTYEVEFKEKYLNNIGNLVLATRGRNARDYNKLPEERSTLSTLISRQKLEVYKKAWGKNEIKQRQDEIVAFALKYWNPENI